MGTEIDLNNGYSNEKEIVETVEAQKKTCSDGKEPHGAKKKRRVQFLDRLFGQDMGLTEIAKSKISTPVDLEYFDEAPETDVFTYKGELYHKKPLMWRIFGMIYRLRLESYYVKKRVRWVGTTKIWIPNCLSWIRDYLDSVGISRELDHGKQGRLYCRADELLREGAKFRDFLREKGFDVDHCQFNNTLKQFLNDDPSDWIKHILKNVPQAGEFDSEAFNAGVQLIPHDAKEVIVESKRDFTYGIFSEKLLSVGINLSKDQILSLRDRVLAASSMKVHSDKTRMYYHHVIQYVEQPGKKVRVVFIRTYTDDPETGSRETLSPDLRFAVLERQGYLPLIPNVKSPDMSESDRARLGVYTNRLWLFRENLYTTPSTRSIIEPRYDDTFGPGSFAKKVEEWKKQVQSSVEQWGDIIRGEDNTCEYDHKGAHGWLNSHGFDPDFPENVRWIPTSLHKEYQQFDRKASWQGYDDRLKHDIENHLATPESVLRDFSEFLQLLEQQCDNEDKLHFINQGKKMRLKLRDELHKSA